MLCLRSSSITRSISFRERDQFLRPRRAMSRRMLPLVALGLAHFLAGDLRLFIVSAFAVPLRYSTEGVPFNDAILTNLKNFWNGISLEPLILGSFAALLVAGLISFLRDGTNRRPTRE